jgi:nicotinic acetylcholine receptor
LSQLFNRLPTSSGEKVTLGLTCFVAFSVFMLMVAEKVPATSDKITLTIVMSLTVSYDI